MTAGIRLGPAAAGWRLIRSTTDHRCKCCRLPEDQRTELERWLCLQKARGRAPNGEAVSYPWIVSMTTTAFGFPISLDSIKNHQRKHCRFERERTDDELRTDREAVKEHVLNNLDARRQRVRDNPATHTEFLEEIVSIGMERILADPSIVSVDHAVSAAKELARVRSEGQRDALLAALSKGLANRALPPQPQQIAAVVEVEVVEERAALAV